MLFTQEMADSLRHQHITVSHLCMTIVSCIQTDLSFSKLKILDPKLPFTSWIPSSLVVKFQDVYEEEKERKVLAGIPLQNTTDKARLTSGLYQLMTFAEDRKVVTMMVLMEELILFLRNSNFR